jgi:hypothetical protein
MLVHFYADVNMLKILRPYFKRNFANAKLQIGKIRHNLFDGAFKQSTASHSIILFI